MRSLFVFALGAAVGAVGMYVVANHTGADGLTRSAGLGTLELARGAAKDAAPTGGGVAETSSDSEPASASPASPGSAEAHAAGGTRDVLEACLSPAMRARVL